MEQLEQRKQLEDFKPNGPKRIVYDPTDADELAEAAARRPRTAIRKAGADVAGADSVRNPSRRAGKVPSSRNP